MKLLLKFAQNCFNFEFFFRPKFNFNKIFYPKKGKLQHWCDEKACGHLEANKTNHNHRWFEIILIFLNNNKNMYLIVLILKKPYRMIRTWFTRMRAREATRAPWARSTRWPPRTSRTLTTCRTGVPSFRSCPRCIRTALTIPILLRATITTDIAFYLLYTKYIIYIYIYIWINFVKTKYIRNSNFKRSWSVIHKKSLCRLDDLFLTICKFFLLLLIFFFFQLIMKILLLKIFLCLN